MKKVKTAREFLRDKLYTENSVFFHNMEFDDLLVLIRQAQIDAVEYTVERCAESACLTNDEDYPDFSNVQKVDKESILNVANKLKEEI